VEDDANKEKGKEDARMGLTVRFFSGGGLDGLGLWVAFIGVEDRQRLRGDLVTKRDGMTSRGANIRISSVIDKPA